ncbi:hypothetical protein HDV02_000310 [Globomyces sp. JEL0801]|nr:hypothetical protein HDV02_000310 [Globomyces sp. JEL0801]
MPSIAQLPSATSTVAPSVQDLKKVAAQSVQTINSAHLEVSVPQQQIDIVDLAFNRFHAFDCL